jgi:hypothetical protein
VEPGKSRSIKEIGRQNEDKRAGHVFRIDVVKKCGRTDKRPLKRSNIKLPDVAPMKRRMKHAAF